MGMGGNSEFNGQAKLVASNVQQLLSNINTIQVHTTPTSPHTLVVGMLEADGRMRVRCVADA